MIYIMIALGLSLLTPLPKVQDDNRLFKDHIVVEYKENKIV